MIDVKKEIEQLLKQRETLRIKHMGKYRNYSATRAQTTSHNAKVSEINDRITHLKEMSKV